MEKNVRLADIYVKIYNKQPLFMEDLAFLAKYDKECFEKTCRNLIYNIPEAKELLEPADGQELLKAAEETPEENQPSKPQETKAGTLESGAPKETDFEINTVLGNLKKMEWQEMPIPDLDVGKVKSLLGSLYMEMLFPHNGRYGYFNLGEGEKSVFNRKV